MRRALLIMLPFFAAITTIVGGFYLWVGARSLMSGNIPAGVLFAGFGLGGFVLAVALWSVRKSIVAPRE